MSEKQFAAYDSYFRKISSEYYLGLKPDLDYTLDSLFATQNDIPTYFLFKKYMFKNFYYYDKGQYKIALNYVDSGINLLKQEHLDKRYSTEYIDALNIKGKDLYALMNYKEAYNYYFMAKVLAEQSKDSCVLGQYVYHMGMAMYNQQKYADAISYFEHSFIYTNTCKSVSTNQMQEYLDNIALCYEKLQIPDSALFYYDSALSYINRHPDVFKENSIGVIYGNIGSVYLSKGITDRAILYLRKSYEASVQPGYDMHDALLTHLKLVKAYLQTGDLDNVTRSLPALTKELDTIRHSLETDCSMHQLMYTYYENTGDVTAAFKHYKSYSELKDSLWKNERKQLQSDVTTELNTRQQEYDISLLQKQNQLSTIYLFVIAFALLLTIVIVFLIYLNYKKSKKNVHELTTLNNKVLLQKTELEKKNNEKDRILNVVAHDLRSPVGGALYIVDMLLRKDGPGDAEKSLGLAKDALGNSLTLINDLLNLSAEGKTFEKEKINIVSVVTEAVHMMQYKANEKQQTILVNTPDTAVITIISAEKISRVMNNLISNAIKFSKTGATIHVDVVKRNGSATVSVIDSGMGIPENIKAGIFDMFTPSQRRGTAGETSYGLGLSISKQIIQLHGGKIWFDTIEGAGTSFYFELPLAAD